jgi:uncharacterized protein (DUF2461 family)
LTRRYNQWLSTAVSSDGTSKMNKTIYYLALAAAATTLAVAQPAMAKKETLQADHR